MALSVREMMLIVSAQNRASGALRRVARDVGGLRNMQGIQRRAQQLRINEQVLRQQRQQAMYNEQSYRTGLKAMQADKARASAKLASMRADIAASNVQQQMTLNTERQLANQARLIGLEKSRPRLPHTVQMRDLRLQAAQIQAARLAEEESILQRKMDAATTAVKRQTMAVRELEAKEAEAARMADYWAGRQNVASLRLAKNAAAIRDLNRAISDARWEKLSRVGSAIQHSGRVAQYYGLVVGGALAFAAKKAADFSTESTLAATQVANKFRNTAIAAKDISNGILQLMVHGKAFADSATQNKAAYDIFSSMTLRGNQRQQISQGMNLLAQFNKAAIAGQVDLADVTHAGITILNNFAQQGQQVQQLPKLLNRMFASVRYGRTTVTEFVGSLNQVAPAFSTAFGRTPQAFDQLSAAMATLTRQMPSVRMAGTGLARLTEMFLRKDFVEGLKKSGLQITDTFGRLKPLNIIIDMLAKRFPQLAKGGQFLANFFKTITALGSGKAGTMGTIQGRRALQELILNQKQYHELTDQVINDNNEFSKSFRALADTSGVKWKLFVQQIHGFVIEVGTNVIPMLTQLGRPLMNMVDWFNKLDDSTKRTISRWLVWSAVGAGAAAVLTLLVGTFIRLFALMGRGIGFFGTLALTVGVLATAISLLSGNWNGLNGIIDTFVSYGTGSVAGWVTMLGLAAVAAIKLQRAIKGVAIASAVSGGAGAAGGIAGMVAGARGLRELYQVRRLEGSSRTMAALAASAALIPGSLAIAAGGIAVVAAGALLWKRHMDQVRADAEETARQAKIINDFTQQPVRSAQRFGGIALNVEDVVRQRNNLTILRTNLADLQKQLASSPADQRNSMRAQISNLKLDIVDAERQLGKLSVTANKSFNSLAAGFQQIGRNAVLLRGAKAELASLLQQRQRYVSDNGDIIASNHNAKILDTQIARVRDHINSLQKELGAVPVVFQGQFNRAIRGLQKIGELPQLKLSARQLQAMFKVDALRGGRLGIPAFKALINAELNPASVRTLGPKLQALVRQYRGEKVQISAEVKIATQGAAAIRRWLGAGGGGKNVVVAHAQITGAQKAAANARLAIERAFSKPVVQHVRVPMPPNMESLGAAIATGIQTGLNKVPVSIHVKEYYDKVITEFHKQGGIHSPSTLMAEMVGKPLGQGIAMGLLQARGDIQKAAALTLDILNGAFLQDREQALKPVGARKIKQLLIAYESAEARLAKKHGNTAINRQKAALAQEKYNDAIHKGHLTVQDLTKDLSQQLTQFHLFNQSISRLRGRGVPSQLLEDLRALGADGAKKIALLAKASAPELRRYVNLWKKAQKEIKQSATIGSADWTSAMKSLASDAANNLLSTYNAFRDTNKQNFGDLFGGPTDLSSHIGDAFQSAMDEYNSQVSDFQSQIRDLNQQIADTQAQALASAIDSFQSQFGQLFGGETLQNAVAANFDQLFNDLQGQVDRFNKWQQTLTSLAGKVPPALAKQLAALGPDASANLEILNNATSDQLSSYVALWQQGQTAIGQAAQAQVATDADLAKNIGDMVAQIQAVTDQLAALSAPQPLNGQMVIDDVKKQLAQWNEYQTTLSDLAKRGLPAELIKQLSEMGPQAEPYLKALASLTDTQLLGPGGFVDTWTKAQIAIDTATTKMMQNQLQLWYSHGANIAAAIIAGVASEQGALLSFFTNLFKSLLTGATPNFTPPGAGTYTGPGSAGALVPGPQAGQTGAGVSSGQNQGFGGAGGIYVAPGASLIQVDAVQDESLDSALQRAAFRLGNRT